MNNKYYDIIIIGSGIAGLYSANKIKETSPETSFIILEKYKKQWNGGRASNEIFYDTQVVTGAGIGRKNKDKLLYNLLQNLELPTSEYIVKPEYSELIETIDINKVMEYLRKEYKKHKPEDSLTFKQFAKPILGEKNYKNFLITSGYTDYENDDVFEVLYYYGMEDNTCCWKAFSVPWKKLVLKLADKIGNSHFKFSNNVISINKVNEKPCKFIIETEKGIKYFCNKVIISTTIQSIRNLLPSYSIYNDIEGQPFLRLYGKFSTSSIPIIKKYVKGYTIVPGPLQKIIPMDSDKGVYMIAYNDNKNTLILKNHLKNTKENRELYCRLLEKSLNVPNNSLQLISIKDFYWPIGTHYYKPLDTNKYKNRDDFVEEAQHPEKGILVVGEVISRNQGWVEGALDSVKSVLTKKWITHNC
jgi:hypothetical protein